ncbi:neurocan core protein, partial [Biomphalaria pfeifferi]
WIGANDINKENYFVWSSDNSSFLNSTWSPSQPNNSGENDDCVEIWSFEKYTNDAPCTFLSHHLCQIAINNIDYRLYVAAISGQTKTNSKHGLLQVTSNSTDVIYVRCK